MIADKLLPKARVTVVAGFVALANVGSVLHAVPSKEHFIVFDSSTAAELKIWSKSL